MLDVAWPEKMGIDPTVGVSGLRCYREIKERHSVLARFRHQECVDHNRELLAIKKGNIFPRYQLNVHIPSAKAHGMIIGHGCEPLR